MHIYIPFVEKVDLLSNPTIVFGLNETETTLGYKRNADNSISALIVDETYAENNLVWVVAINESVNTNGVIEQAAQPNEDAAHASQQASHRVNDRVVKVQSIHITDLKETWIRGKAEVSFVSVKLWNPCTTDEVLRRQELKKVSNSQLGNWLGNGGLGEIANHPSFGSNVTPLSDGKSVYLIMFEYDAVAGFSFNSSICPNRSLTVNTRNGIYGAIDLLDATTLNIPNSAGAANQYWIRTWGTSAPNYSGIQLEYRIF